MSEVVIKGKKKPASVLNNQGVLIQWSVCPWVNEDRFKRKQIFTDIKEPPMKVAHHNSVVVSCILMRIREEKAQEELEVFQIPNLYIFHTGRYFTAICVQGCVHGCVHDHTGSG